MRTGRTIYDLSVKITCPLPDWFYLKILKLIKFWWDFSDLWKDAVPGNLRLNAWFPLRFRRKINSTLFPDLPSPQSIPTSAHTSGSHCIQIWKSIRRKQKKTLLSKHWISKNKRFPDFVPKKSSQTNASIMNYWTFIFFRWKIALYA